MEVNKIYQGDSLKVLKDFPEESIDMCMTSPPYFNQRDYGVKGQLGLEKTPEEYINNLCNIFDEVRRVIKKTGTCWVNIGDCYGGYQGKNNGYPDRKNEKADIPQIKRDKSMAKSLMCIPELFLIEMIKRGWLIRNKIVWWKPNVMPSSAKDRFTIDYEMLYFFVKSKKYYFEQQLEPLVDSSLKDKRLDKGRQEHKGKSASKIYATNATVIKSEGRNKRTVWRITTKPSKEGHYAMYPEKLCETPIKAGCIVGGAVLDPFFGSGTTGLTALKLGRNFIGIELNSSYIKIAEARIKSFLEQRKL
jgi:site-specific DNA-methyltransferase (adenine-specific)